MNCLDCGSPLETTDRENVSIDLCTACGGTWLDGDELRTAVERADQPTSEQEQAIALAARSETISEGDGRDCPRCEEPMERHVYDAWSGITIDTCVEHGIWLDGGELERIEAWVEGSRDTAFIDALEENNAQLREANIALDKALAKSKKRWGPLAWLVQLEQKSLLDV